MTKRWPMSKAIWSSFALDHRAIRAEKGSNRPLRRAETYTLWVVGLTVLACVTRQQPVKCWSR
jgi:hypothetical protein